MEFALKLLICALLSFSVGIACASPLLVTELNIRPWLHYVQGPNAQFNVEVIYANFTVQNADKPITRTGGPQISYYVVVNATNLSNYVASWTSSAFVAAKEIKNVQFSNNGTQTWSAEGATVDGVWYNVSWVGDSIPRIENGEITSIRWGTGYWMEGVQLFDTYRNGNITATYMNMNGTWVDVTGKIDVQRTSGNTMYSRVGVVTDFSYGFDNAPVRDYSEDGTALDSPEPFGSYKLIIRLVDQPGYFNTTFAPGESRLIVFSDTYSAPLDNNAVKTIQSGRILLKTEFHTEVPSEISYNDNTVTTTISTSVEQKQAALTKTGDSYIFSPQGYTSANFYPDKWNMEVFLANGGA